MLSKIERTKFYIQPFESRRLIATSYLSLAPISYALWQNSWFFAITSTGTLVCSVLYWSNPVHGWRRDLDLAYAKYSFVSYYIGGAFYIPYGRPYIIFHCGGISIICSYYMTYVFPKYWLQLHMTFHVLSIIMKLYILSYLLHS